MIKVFIVLAVATLVQGYPKGAPEAQCVHMTPNHYGATNPTSPPPFSISVSTRHYKSGESVVVILNATEPDKTKFRGFILSARRADCTEPDKTVGWFSLIEPDDGVKTMSCDGKYMDTVTHANREDKIYKMFEWRNPGGEDVYFKYTVVQNTPTFWTNIKTGAVYDQGTRSNYSTCAASKPIPTHNIRPMTTMMYETTTWDGHYPVSAAVKLDMSIFALLACASVLFL